MTRKLDRLIVGTFVRIFTFFVLSVPVMFILGDQSNKQGSYIDRGLSMQEIFWGYVFEYPNFVLWSFPVAALVGTVFTIHSMTVHREIQAAKAGGISFHRLVAPLWPVGAVLTVAAFFLGTLVTTTNRIAAEIFREVEMRRDWRNNFVFQTDDGEVLNVQELRVSAGAMRGVILQSTDAEGRPDPHVGSGGLLRGGGWVDLQGGPPATRLPGRGARAHLRLPSLSPGWVRRDAAGPPAGPARRGGDDVRGARTSGGECIPLRGGPEQAARGAGEKAGNPGRDARDNALRSTARHHGQEGRRRLRGRRLPRIDAGVHPSHEAVRRHRDRGRPPSAVGGVGTQCDLPSGGPRALGEGPNVKSVRLCLVPWALTVPPPAQLAAEQRPDAPTRDDYARAESFLAPNTSRLVFGATVRPQWLADGRLWYRNTIPDGAEFVLVNATVGARERAFDHERLAGALSEAADASVSAFAIPVDALEIGEGGQLVALTAEIGDGGERYRCGLDSFICEATAPVSPADANAIASPDGTRAAFIQDHNLWLRDLESGAEWPLTTDGVQDYGYATNNAGWIRRESPVLLWSPDSRMIATFQHDGRGVGMMHMATTRVGHPELQSWRYPLPGDSVIFRIERVVIHVDEAPDGSRRGADGGARVTRLQMPPDPHRSSVTDHVADPGGVFLDVEWSPDGAKLAFVSSSRDHKVATLRIANPQTGEVRDVLTESEETFFESGPGPRIGACCTGPARCSGTRSVTTGGTSTATTWRAASSWEGSPTAIGTFTALCTLTKRAEPPISSAMGASPAIRTSGTFTG